MERYAGRSIYYAERGRRSVEQMNVMVERSKTRVYRQWGLCLALVSIFVPALEGHSQVIAEANGFLPPPRSNLVPLHWPDLAKLEAEVREQLMSLQAALAVTVKNPNATPAALSEA